MKDIITYLKELRFDIQTLHEENMELRSLVQHLAKRIEWLENEVSINDGRQDTNMMRSESEVKELLEKMKKDYIQTKGAMPRELLTGFNMSMQLLRWVLHEDEKAIDWQDVTPHA